MGAGGGGFTVGPRGTASGLLPLALADAGWAGRLSAGGAAGASRGGGGERWMWK